MPPSLSSGCRVRKIGELEGLTGIRSCRRSNSHRSNNTVSTECSDCSAPHPLFSSISVKHYFHIDRPSASNPTAMSAPASSEPALKSLQKRLKSLHDRRHNLDAHFLSIRQEAGRKLEHYAFISRIVYEALVSLRDPENSWRYWPFLLKCNLTRRRSIGLLLGLNPILRGWRDGCVGR